MYRLLPLNGGEPFIGGSQMKSRIGNFSLSGFLTVLTLALLLTLTSTMSYASTNREPNTFKSSINWNGDDLNLRDSFKKANVAQSCPFMKSGAGRAKATAEARDSAQTPVDRKSSR
jgi:hypothetical protein